jgi:SAM-dependent methyltransferase
MSLARLQEHRRIWTAKPVLRDVYAVWFEALLAALGDARAVLEVGAGPGFLSPHAREHRPGVTWVSADLVDAPWNDVVADALALPFAPDSLDAIAGVDVLHHLAEPERFFREARRVLRPGGCLAFVEPWVTPFSFPVYRWLHQEGCRLSLDPWAPFPAAGNGKDPFDGDAAVVWSLLRKTPAERWRQLGFAAPQATALNGFAYLPTLGFRPGSLLPATLAPALIALDRWTRPLARWTGMRVLVRWQSLRD